MDDNTLERIAVEFRFRQDGVAHHYKFEKSIEEGDVDEEGGDDDDA